MMYIEPGTESMLFAVLIGVLGVGVYSSNGFMMKFRGKISGGKIEIAQDSGSSLFLLQTSIKSIAILLIVCYNDLKNMIPW